MMPVGSGNRAGNFQRDAWSRGKPADFGERRTNEPPASNPERPVDNSVAGQLFSNNVMPTAVRNRPPKEPRAIYPQPVIHRMFPHRPES
jgi:hypothetical protein